MDALRSPSKGDRSPIRPKRAESIRQPLLLDPSRLTRQQPPKKPTRRPTSSNLPTRRKKYASKAWVIRLLGWWTTAAALFLIYAYRRVIQSLAPPAHAISNSIHTTPTSVRVVRPQRQTATTIYGVAVHERTRGLLEILLSAQGSDTPPWPSCLTLHSPPDETILKDEDTTTNSCIVTAYFRIPSKFSNEKYEKEWMQHILTVNDCMVIFCEKHMVQAIQNLRDNRPTAIVTLQLQDLPMAKYYFDSKITANSDNPAKAFWEHQFMLDQEHKRHQSYQLFWIWLSKSWFVSTAITLQQYLFPKRSTQEPIDYWMWADIGSFRIKSYSNKQVIQHPEALAKDTTDPALFWMAHHTPNPPKDPLWNRKLDKKEKDHFYHSGSTAFGTATAWRHFHAHFCETLTWYGADKFLGEDQCVLQSTCLLQPHHCAYVPYDQVHDNRYFGLRHVLKFGVDDSSNNNSKLQPFQLWRPPARTGVV